MIRASGFTAPVLIATVLAACGEADGPLRFDAVSQGLAPLDATPDADGSDVWFVGASDGQPGLFHVDETGAVSTVWSGAPLVSPRNLSVAVDDSVVYVADPGAADGGAIHVITVAGEVRDPLAVGLAPTGVHAEPAGSLLVVGQDEQGAAAVFRVDVELGEVSFLATGAPLTEPGGVVSTDDGAVFVTDGSGAQSGSLFQVGDDGVVSLLDGLTLGDPAGLASTLDGSTLVLSVIDGDTGNDAVLLYDRAGQTAVSTSDGIEGNVDGGGVHRAANADTWAWADTTIDGGTVYRVNLSSVPARNYY